MSYHIIDMTNDPRSGQFAYFRQMLFPFAGVTAEVDITDFAAQRQGRPFFLSFLYAVVRAANAVPQLRRRILPDGSVVTGRTSPLLGASAALLLNALKKMAGIDHKLDLIPSSVIEPISAMKTGCLGHRNPRLHSDKVLIALAISGLTNPLAAMVQAQLKNLRGCEAHFSVIISEEDAKLYKRLGINVSCEAKYEVKSLYHK